MPPSAPSSSTAVRGRSRRGVLLSELGVGLLLGVAGGWITGLVRVRRPVPPQPRERRTGLEQGGTVT